MHVNGPPGVMQRIQMGNCHAPHKRSTGSQFTASQFHVDVQLHLQFQLTIGNKSNIYIFNFAASKRKSKQKDNRMDANANADAAADADMLLLWFYVMWAAIGIVAKLIKGANPLFMKNACKHLVSSELD